MLQKKMCKNAPFYVLGPLVTDIAPGYDHITSAIGGAIAASAGADYLCYVTPAEHLKLPNSDDVHEGVIASKIAAHAADIVKGVPGALERDNKMAICRNQLDWKGQIELSLDPAKAARLRHEGGGDKTDACSMCGSYCRSRPHRCRRRGGWAVRSGAAAASFGVWRFTTVSKRISCAYILVLVLCRVGIK